jgi:hypothetical protein
MASGGKSGEKNPLESLFFPLEKMVQLAYLPKLSVKMGTMLLRTMAAPVRGTSNRN